MLLKDAATSRGVRQDKILFIFISFHFLSFTFGVNSISSKPLIVTNLSKHSGISNRDYSVHLYNYPEV